MMAIGVPELLILFLIVVPLVIPACLICRKAGYSPWLGLVSIVPFTCFILIWFLALASWPALRPGSTRPA